MVARSHPVAAHCVLLALACFAAAQQPPGTEFTYQGRLLESGRPADGTYDLRFRLFDADVDGAQVGPTLCGDNVTVIEGLFTIPLDFGAAPFPGSARWLAIDVRPDGTPGNCGAGAYTELSPRQAITAAPYALQTRGIAVDTLANVGIGTASPGYPLHVMTPALTAVRAESSAATGQSSTGHFVTASDIGNAVFGSATATTGSATGVRGSSSGPDGKGVYGRATSATGFSVGVHGESGSQSGAGVYGQATASTGTSFGVYGTSPSTTGIGVFGEATAGTGANYGGYFLSAGTSSRAVVGYATNLDGDSYGGYFESFGPAGRGVFGGGQTGVHGVSWAGRGVYGQVVSSAGTSYGGYFENPSTSGRGIFATATAASGTTYGGYFQNASSGGRGLFGDASAAAGTTYGVWGRSASTAGRGVFGEATASSGATAGVWGRSASTTGQGVLGHATAATGTSAGVFGQADSTSGSGVVGLAPAGTGGTYGGYFESASTSGRGVFGDSTALLGATYGGYFRTASTSGRGVFGFASRLSGTTFGVHGQSDSPTGYGVYSTGDLRVAGDLTVTGSKGGYVTDLVVNAGDEPLECGDVVEIVGHAPAIVGDIPVIAVRRAQGGKSRAVLGPVECAVQVTLRAEEEPDAALPERLRYAAPQYHVHRTDGPLQPGDYGRVVTLGAFKAIRVDAAFGAIQPGDLLVSSPNAGHAMRSDDPQAGTVIGKALGQLASGRSAIPVLVQAR